MKRQRLFELENGMEKLNNLKGVKFSYAMTKNKRVIKEELEIYRELLKDEDYAKLAEKRIAINVECAVKNEDGSPKIENGHYVIDPKNQKRFEDELKTLFEENNDIVEAFENKQKEYNQMLKEELPAEVMSRFHMIKMGDIPTDISTEEMGMIIDFIHEE